MQMWFKQYKTGCDETVIKLSKIFRYILYLPSPPCSYLDWLPREMAVMSELPADPQLGVVWAINEVVALKRATSAPRQT